MARLTTFVDDATEKQIKEQAAKEGISISEYTASLIKLGLKIKQLQQDGKQQDEDKKRAELEAKHTEFIMRILNISSEVLRCVYDEDKMKNKTGSAQGALERIDEKVKDYINQYIGIKTDPD